MKLIETCKQLSKFKQFCTQSQYAEQFAKAITNSKVILPQPEYDLEYLCNPINRDSIFDNIQKRKGVGDIDKVIELSKRPEEHNAFLTEVSKIPNRTHPKVLEYGNKPLLLKEHGQKPDFDFTPEEFSELCNHLKLLRMGSLGPVSGHRSYVLQGELADLEQALINYSIKRLMTHGFKIVSVPDIIPTKVIERCGLISDNGRTLIYNLDPDYGDNFSLSGTAEMSLAFMLANRKLLYEELPMKLAAVSRCYRAEGSRSSNERGIYRVHQFTKVEMFVCSSQDDSEKQFENLQTIQEELFSSLGLHFQVIDMPPDELGAPAYRKTDIEGWMPGRKLYGELSSCSNCTDYQSRRLNIKYESKDGQLLHVHTLNGTACAVPRMLIAICEMNQSKHGRIEVPEQLLPYMKESRIKKQQVADMRVYKYKPKIKLD